MKKGRLQIPKKKTRLEIPRFTIYAAAAYASSRLVPEDMPAGIYKGLFLVLLAVFGWLISMWITEASPENRIGILFVLWALVSGVLVHATGLLDPSSLISLVLVLILIGFGSAAGGVATTLIIGFLSRYIKII